MGIPLYGAAEVQIINALHSSQNMDSDWTDGLLCSVLLCRGGGVLFSFFLDKRETEPNFASQRTPTPPGCRKPITYLIKPWIDSFRPPCPSCFGRVRMMPRSWRHKGGRGEERSLARLRQMPYSSHRGYFVTSKWPFWLLQAQDVNVPQDDDQRRHSGSAAQTRPANCPK